MLKVNLKMMLQTQLNLQDELPGLEVNAPKIDLLVSAPLDLRQGYASNARFVLIDYLAPNFLESAVHRYLHPLMQHKLH